MPGRPACCEGHAPGMQPDHRPSTDPTTAKLCTASQDVPNKCYIYGTARTSCVLTDERVLEAGGALDLAELCIVVGKTCWVIFVDGLVLNADGSVVDALSIATKVLVAVPWIFRFLFDLDFASGTRCTYPFLCTVRVIAFFTPGVAGNSDRLPATWQPGMAGVLSIVSIGGSRLPGVLQGAAEGPGISFKIGFKGGKVWPAFPLPAV